MKASLALILCALLPALSLVAQTAPPRHALVMGVGDYGGATYKGKTIPNLPGITTADLPNMAAKLESLGFAVTVVSNPTLGEAKTAVDAFSAKLKAAPGVSLFYFSGHGGESEGKNYLIPRRASIGSKADLADEALSAQRVLNGMEESGAQVNLVFLDCCREDLGKNIGGAEMQPMRARGSFIGFATRSGDFADPGEEGSPYTRFLLKHLDKPGVSVADMYGYVVKDVKDYTKQVLGEERRPGFYSELEGEPFYFMPANLKRDDTTDMQAQIERRARELAARMAPNTAPPSASSVPAESARKDSVMDSITAGQVFEVKLPGGAPMKFCYCPPGSFTMGEPTAYGSEDEEQVQVEFSKGFWMAQTECTQAQWTSVMKKNPSKFKGSNLPVECINYEDTLVFMSKVNSGVNLPPGYVASLPTEAQWEYACRAGTVTRGSFGDEITSKQANYNGMYDMPPGPYLAKTSAVASYPQNPWGLYDMHGNVMEWCADKYIKKLPGGVDPKVEVGRGNVILRGGAWDRGAAGSGDRCSDDPNARNSIFGFRPALVLAK